MLHRKKTKTVIHGLQSLPHPVQMGEDAYLNFNFTYKANFRSKFLFVKLENMKIKLSPEIELQAMKVKWPRQQKVGQALREQTKFDCPR